jgi:hypothetical protein
VFILPTKKKNITKLKKYLEINNINFIETDNILIHRVRENGTILRDN